MFDARECIVKLPAQTAFELRYILPLVAEACAPIDDNGSTVAMIDQAVAAIHEALPADLCDLVDERAVAEYRMDAIDAQRTAGVRPSCRCIQSIQGCPVHDPTQQTGTEQGGGDG